MGRNTKIEWADATVNPVRGCRRKSPGCQRCFAERLAATRLRHLDKYDGLATMTPNGPRWSGLVQLDIDAMKKVLTWKKSKRIFVCDMSDLFYEEVPDEFIERVFAVMAVAQQHQFQILTKRPDRMRKWFESAPPLYKTRAESVSWWAEAMDLCIWDSRGNNQNLYRQQIEKKKLNHRKVFPGWPLPNVWLGTSIENQKMANERIPELLDTPAAIRYISYEPALEPVTLLPWWLSIHLIDLEGTVHMPEENGIAAIGGAWRYGLDWVIAGAESGPGHRPCQMDWIKSLKDQCEQAEVAFFFKQFMENGKKVSLPMIDDKQWAEMPGSVSSTK